MTENEAKDIVKECVGLLISVELLLERAFDALNKPKLKLVKNENLPR